MSRVRILNGDFDPITLRETVDRAFALVRSGARGWIATVNVAILMMMRSDPRLARFADRAAFVVADGQPIVWASRILHAALPERVTGVGLIDALCERAAQEGTAVYLLGARADVVQRVADRLVAQHPGLRIAGAADGYFTDAEASARARAVAASGAGILLVAMGVPRQERFVEEQWDALGVNVALPVGGSFDVIAGLRRRAPLVLQRVGLEWLFRLAQEPRRLWRRYLVTNVQFAVCLAREIAARALGAGRVARDGGGAP